MIARLIAGRAEPLAPHIRRALPNSRGRIEVLGVRLLEPVFNKSLGVLEHPRQLFGRQAHYDLIGVLVDHLKEGPVKARLMSDLVAVTICRKIGQ